MSDADYVREWDGAEVAAVPAAFAMDSEKPDLARANRARAGSDRLEGPAEAIHGSALRPIDYPTVHGE